MPRKRMIDPEFWSDEEIGRWTHQARLFYIGLWTFSDDEGRFKANDALLKANIFPYDTRVNIKKLKQEISKKVQFYIYKDSQYGFVCNFLKYQVINHPTKSKLPPPSELSEDSLSPTVEVPPNLKEVNISKDKHGEFVLLTKKEYESLLDAWGKSALSSLIDELSDYIGQSGKKYKSHYHTLKNWYRRKPREEHHGMQPLKNLIEPKERRL